MNKAVELFIKLNQPKSVSIQPIRFVTNQDQLRRDQLLSALDLTNSQHHIGMLIIKNTYLASNITTQQELINIIKERCKDASLFNIDTCCQIIFCMLTDKPLSTQFKKLRSSFNNFSNASTIYKRQQAKNKRELKKLYGNSTSKDNDYRIEQLEQVIVQSKKAYNKSITEQAQTTTQYPKCSGSGCSNCSSGHITATMRDAQAQFETHGITFIHHKFLTEYWAPILYLVSEFQLHKIEAMSQMKYKLEHLR